MRLLRSLKKHKYYILDSLLHCSLLDAKMQKSTLFSLFELQNSKCAQKERVFRPPEKVVKMKYLRIGHPQSSCSETIFNDSFPSKLNKFVLFWFLKVLWSRVRKMLTGLTRDVKLVHPLEKYKRGRKKCCRTFYGMKKNSNW